MQKSFGLLVPLALGGLLAMGGAATATDKYKDTSRELVVQAHVALTSESAEDAQLLFERALVANPANLQALIGLGKSHEAQGRVGRGLKYYRQALSIDPNAFTALEAQALAFLKRDMVERAEANRDKLARLCTGGCGELDTVDTAIKGYQTAQKADVADASTSQE